MKKSCLWHWLAPLLTIPLIASCDGTPVHNTGSAASAASGISASASSNATTEIGQTVDANTSKKLSENLIKKMQKAFKGQELNIQNIYTTPFKGIYEVVITGNQIIYTDENADYIMLGNLLDLQRHQNLTEQRLSELSKVDFDQLPLDKAIKEVRGNGQRIMAVFSDPDCPFCKKLEEEIAQIDNVTVYTFLMPVPELHPKAQKKSVQIWCQKDRTTAWTAWMRHGKEPASVADCNNPVAETMKLGDKFGFNGTPTMIFPNGKTISGLMRKNDLEQELNDNQK
ncbi:DsbC family protein [Snodgrassella gandavensis]|uniref:DsbC family protein n=1 Tax=Snodgrassella gandavensis TaxID=2946698 RepID=UPI001EF718C8|nr:DsbC family protein [Snodgrassella gandavensis]